MNRTIKIVYLPLTKTNWTNPEQEKARSDTRQFWTRYPE